MAGELVAGAVAACKEQGYNVTATLVVIDGVRPAMLRGDGAGIATLDVSNKAYTAMTTRSDTGVLVDSAASQIATKHFEIDDLRQPLQWIAADNAFSRSSPSKKPHAPPLPIPPSPNPRSLFSLR